MAGDFSRNSVNKAAGYAGVLMQQGRVQLDADWNEQLALAAHRTQTETRDVIGCCGTPKGENGFKIEVTPDGTDFFIHLGRFYVGGLLCENGGEWVELAFRSENPIHRGVGPRILIKRIPVPVLPSAWLDNRPLKPGDWVEVKAANKPETLRTRIVSIGENLSAAFSPSIIGFENAGSVLIRRAPTYLTQPFYPSPDTGGAGESPLSSPAGGGLDLADGKYLVYLEAWQREVNALEDPHLREVALGGPDTAERLQTVWQVKLLKISEPVELPPEGEHRPCQEKLTEWTELLAGKRTTGQMNARSTPAQPDSNPCILPPSAGFQGLENQLYRVEIFQSSETLAGATFVWSRDNAMVETGIVSVDTANNNVITVQDLGKDSVPSFNVNDWVEVVDRASELNGSTRFLAQIVPPAPDPSSRKITLSTPLPNPDAVNSPGDNVFRLRRWDMSASSVTSEGIPAAAGWLPLESGVEVEFTEGAYVSRSYWLVPARTATADVEWPPFQVPNAQPIPQSPLGEFHYFCRLALLDSVYGKWTLGDCRLQFPPLTNICADDVCYHSDCDGLKETQTVKEALDQLCEEAKLRFHKKYLHGWGIVCDLQVECAGDETGSSVIVNKGYAIDCEGNDILLHKPVTFNVLANIQTPSGIADGAYSLYFDTFDGNKLRVAPYTPPANRLTDALAGTFWPDYYAQYIQPIVDIWQELQKVPANAIVKDSQRVVSSLTNLLVQLVRNQNENEVYISQIEHEWLVKVYELLRRALHDTTFCGIWNFAQKIPSYPLESIGGIGTGFGEGFKTRLRMNETGQLAAAVGNDNTIHLYRIENQLPALTEVLAFPGDSSAVVRDVGFSTEGNILYAIATEGGNSTFAFTNTAAVSWTSVALPGITLASLLVLDSVPYATGVGKGLYSFTSASGAITATLVSSFNAIGQMAAPDPQHLFFTTNSNTSVTNAFNEVIYLNHLPSGFARSGAGELPNQISGTAADDLQVAPGPPQTELTFKVYLTANPAAAGSNKLLLVGFVRNDVVGPWSQIDLGQNSTVRLAYRLQFQQMMLSVEGTNRILALIETTAPQFGVAPVLQLSLADAFAAEVSPVSFLASDRAEALYVLNAISNTITVIPYKVKIWSPAQFQTLGEYRTQMLSAYSGLLGFLIQYLKDGFCDLLLLKCPACNEDRDQPVYLAGITVKNGRVYKVCNFTQRRYVKTFPGVDYWLSVVPVLPILELAVKELCCLTLTDLVSKRIAPQSLGGTFTSVPAADIAFSAMKRLRTAGISPLTMNLLNRITPVAGIAGDYVSTMFSSQAAPSVSANVVTGQPVQEAQKQLAQQKVAVDVRTYDGAAVRTNIVRSAAAPSSIPAGSSVTLYTDSNGNVKGFEVAPPQVQALQTEVKSVQVAQAAAQPILSATPGIESDLAALKIQLTNLQTAHQQELASRDAQIAQLTASTQQLQTSLSEVKTQITKIALPPPKA
jgi:hypothetical protein